MHGGVVLCLLFTFMVLTGVLIGCRGEEAVSQDTGPFRDAIATYLAGKNMGMKVAGFESLDVEGEAATALCRMQEASGLYNLSVRWRFEFRCRPDGAWQVQGHQAL